MFNRKTKRLTKIGQVIVSALLVSIVFLIYLPNVNKASALTTVDGVQTGFNSSTPNTVTTGTFGHLTSGDIMVVEIQGFSFGSGTSESCVGGSLTSFTITDSQANTYSKQGCVASFGGTYQDYIYTALPSSTGVDFITYTYVSGTKPTSVGLEAFDVSNINLTPTTLVRGIATNSPVNNYTSSMKTNSVTFTSNSFVVAGVMYGCSCPISSFSPTFTGYGTDALNLAAEYSTVANSPTTFPMVQTNPSGFAELGAVFQSTSPTTTVTTTITPTASTSCSGANNCDDLNTSKSEYVGKDVVWYVPATNTNFAGTIDKINIELANVKINTVSTSMILFIGVTQSPPNGQVSFTNPYISVYQITTNQINNGSTNLVITFTINQALSPNQNFIIGFMATSTASRCGVGCVGTSGISVYETNVSTTWTYLNNGLSNALPQIIYTGISPNPEQFYEWVHITYSLIVVTTTLFNSTLTVFSTVISTVISTSTAYNLQGQNAGATVTNLITYIPFWIFPLLFGAIGAATGLGAQGLIFGFIIGGFMGYELGLFPIWMIFVLVVVLYLMIRR